MKSKRINIFPELTPELPDTSLEKGIIKIVGILNEKGLATEMSCEGHSQKYKEKAWVRISPSSFKGYMKSNTSKMERFLKAGEGKWYLEIVYCGLSRFRGLGQSAPRKKNLKRVVDVEMEVTIILMSRARNSGETKTSGMRSMENAAKKYL